MKRRRVEVSVTDEDRELLEAETRNADAEEEQDKAWDRWGAIVTDAAGADALSDDQVAVLAMMFRPKKEAP